MQIAFEELRKEAESHSIAWCARRPVVPCTRTRCDPESTKNARREAAYRSVIATLQETTRQDHSPDPAVAARRAATHSRADRSHDIGGRHLIDDLKKE